MATLIGDTNPKVYKEGAIFVGDLAVARTQTLAAGLLTQSGPLDVQEGQPYPAVYGTKEDAERCLATGLDNARLAGDRVISSGIIKHNNTYKVRIIYEAEVTEPPDE